MQNNEIIIPILNPQIEQLPLYITQICVQFQQNNLVERADGFEDYQLAICLSAVSYTHLSESAQTTLLFFSHIAPANFSEVIP